MEIHKILKYLNPKKATAPDKFPVKIVKLAANLIDMHLRNIINNDLLRSMTNILKDDRAYIKNYRPVSVLNSFSKIYEKFLN